jgi:hypothetical protein
VFSVALLRKHPTRPSQPLEQLIVQTYYLLEELPCSNLRDPPSLTKTLLVVVHCIDNPHHEQLHATETMRFL